ncbi:hypothetical protein TNCV_2714031 [Trichonephila clavipes]|nr:hypothetical protein TNCV_2714031 [Trichonephila clavipes]
MRVSYQRRMDFRTLANARNLLKSPATTAILATMASSKSTDLRKQDSSYDPRGKIWSWSGQACLLPVYRSTFQSHICAEMCRRSVMLEPHTSLYLGWNTLQ